MHFSSLFISHIEGQALNKLNLVVEPFGSRVGLVMPNVCSIDSIHRLNTPVILWREFHLPTFTCILDQVEQGSGSLFVLCILKPLVQVLHLVNHFTQIMKVTAVVDPCNELCNLDLRVISASVGSFLRVSACSKLFVGRL